MSSNSKQMKAVLIKDGKGPAENLYIGDTECPQATMAGQVVIKVKFFGINRSDTMQRNGGYPIPKGTTPILGLEFSGVVSELGPEVTNVKKGDEVFGLTYGGAYAEYVLVNANMLLHKPAHLSWVEAASIPEVWLTAYQALRLVGDFQDGESVLIHAGASGVGIAAIQLANLFQAKHIFTTAGSDDKLDFLKTICRPPTHTINYKKEDFSTRVKQDAEGGGVNLIIDMIGQDYWSKNLDSLGLEGRMVMLGLLSGTELPAGTSITPIIYKRLTIRGSTLRSRSPEYQANLAQRFEQECLPYFASEGSGAFKTYVHKVYPWTEIQEAHREMEASKNTGKIIAEIV